MTGALAGRTVVVTRAAAQASALRVLLEAEGAAVFELPLIATTEPDDDGTAVRAALDRVDDFDWIVVTSPNGAARVAAGLGERAVRPRFAAVGPGTAAALGRDVAVRPARQVAEGMLEVFPDGPGRVLVVQGDLARPTLVDGLVDRGWTVERVVAYRTVPVPVDAEALARVIAADALTFASGSAVRAFVAAVDDPSPIGADRGVGPAIVSIGPETSAVAAELGLRVDRTAAMHDLAGLVAAVVAELTEPR